MNAYFATARRITRRFTIAVAVAGTALGPAAVIAVATASSA